MCREKERAPSTTRRNRRLRRLPHAARPLERSRGEERQGPIAPLRRGEHGAAVREPRRGQLKAVQDFLQDGQVTIDVFGLVRRRGAACAPGRAGADRLSASTFAVGEESMNLGARQAFIATPRGGGGPARQCDAVAFAAANRSVSRSSCARGRSGTSSRAEPSMPSTCGLSSKPPTRRADDLPQWRPRRRRGPVDPGAHLYRSLLLDEHGNPSTSGTRGRRVRSAYVRLIPPGAADTIHYRLDVPDDVGERIVADGKGQLPQVQLVEHAVGVRRCARSERRARSRSPRTMTMGDGCLRATRRRCRER